MPQQEIRPLLLKAFDALTHAPLAERKAKKTELVKLIKSIVSSRKEGTFEALVAVIKDVLKVFPHYKSLTIPVIIRVGNLRLIKEAVLMHPQESVKLSFVSWVANLKKPERTLIARLLKREFIPGILELIDLTLVRPEVEKNRNGTEFSSEVIKRLRSSDWPQAKKIVSLYNTRLTMSEPVFQRYISGKPLPVHHVRTRVALGIKGLHRTLRSAHKKAFRRRP